MNWATSVTLIKYALYYRVTECIVINDTLLQIREALLIALSSKQTQQIEFLTNLLAEAVCKVMSKKHASLLPDPNIAHNTFHRMQSLPNLAPSKMSFRCGVRLKCCEYRSVKISLRLVILLSCSLPDENWQPRTWSMALSFLDCRWRVLKLVYLRSLPLKHNTWS